MQSPERRKPSTHTEFMLSDQQLEEIIEKAADRAVEKMQHQIFVAVGKGVLTKLFYIIGLAAVGLWAWLESKGFFH